MKKSKLIVKLLKSLADPAQDVHKIKCTPALRRAIEKEYKNYKRVKEETRQMINN
jgi:hypothetical protein